MLSEPSHEVVGEEASVNGIDAIFSSSPDGDAFLPPLLPILDSARTYESTFSEWFEANFAVPDYHARLLSTYAAQPQLILDWLGLLYTAWCAFITARASAAFGARACLGRPRAVPSHARRLCPSLVFMDHFL